MAEKVIGTVAQFKSKYQYYLMYSTTFDNDTMQWEVLTKVYLLVSYANCIGDASHFLSIDGAIKERKTNYPVKYMSPSGSKEYLIASETSYYKASATARKLKVSSTMTIYLSNSIQEQCKVNAIIELPAKLNLKGNLHCTTSKNTVRVVLSDLTTGLGYSKTAKIYYKPSTASSYTHLGKFNIPDTIDEFSKTFNGLPGTKYSIKVQLYANDRILVNTLTDSVVTAELTVQFNVRNITDSSVEVQSLSQQALININKKVYFYCKLKDAFEWGAPIATYDITTSFCSYSYTYTGLTPDKDYEFKVVWTTSKEEPLGRATTVCRTAKGPQDPNVTEVEVTSNELVLDINDKSSNIPVHNKIVVYARSEDKVYFVGEQTIEFIQNVMRVKFPVLNEDIKQLLANPHRLLVLLLQDGNYEIKYIAHTG